MSTFIKEVVLQVYDVNHYSSSHTDKFIFQIDSYYTGQYNHVINNALDAKKTEYSPTLLSVTSNTSPSDVDVTPEGDNYVMFSKTLVTVALGFDSKKQYQLFKLMYPEFSKVFDSHFATIVGERF